MGTAEYDLMDVAEERMWWYRALHREVLDTVQAARPAPGPLLDAGCGTGGFLRQLRQDGPSLPATGLEYNPDAAGRARAKSGARIVVGSVNAMPFETGSFAIVVCLDVLCHAAVLPEQALAEMVRVLVPGGLLVVNLPAFDWLHSAHDLRVHSARRYNAGNASTMLTAAGLVRVRPRYWNSLLLPLMVLQRKVIARASDHGSDVAPLPRWLDRSLHAVTRLERHLTARGLAFPAGGSVLATGVRA